MLEEDTPALQKRAKQSKDYREVQRLRALYAISVGNRVQAVAQIFDVHESTIYEC
ncbi:helix-turn-helix domain-containing protein [Candidatus Micrarchaeota archaeon]|nr:helix-turn-helix domain-containing protein [Candidatus Micrarchaeota archaeon]